VYIAENIIELDPNFRIFNHFNHQR